MDSTITSVDSDTSVADSDTPKVDILLCLGTTFHSKNVSGSFLFPLIGFRRYADSGTHDAWASLPWTRRPASRLYGRSLLLVLVSGVSIAAMHLRVSNQPIWTPVHPLIHVEAGLPSFRSLPLSGICERGYSPLPHTIACIERPGGKSASEDKATSRRKTHELPLDKHDSLPGHHSRIREHAPVGLQQRRSLHEQRSGE